MGSRGRRRSLKRKRTNKEPTASPSESEGVNLMERNSRKDQSPSSEAQQPASAERKKKEKRKRKRVVRERLSEKLIHVMMVHSSSVYEIPGERLARLSEEFQADYAKCKASDEKWQAEQQDLIDQYLINSYAESVREVTDDEDDDTAEIDGSKGG